MLGGNIDQEAPKIEKSIDDIANAGKRAVESARAAVQEQKDVILQIEADMKNIEAKISKAAPGNEKNQLIQELNSAKQALAEEKAALGDYAAKVDETAEANVRLRTQVMNAKQALDQMAQAGLRGTEVYAQQQEILGGLQQRMNAANKQAKVLGDPEGGMHAATQTVTGMAGAFTAATGAMSLFAGENEDMAKIQMRLQAVMAITIGLTQAAEMLNENSYSRLKILVPIKDALAAAELKVAAAMGISTVAARALMATLTIGLSIAITALIVLYEQYKSAQEKVAERQKLFIEISSEANKEFAKQAVNIEALRAVLNSATASYKDKETAIRKLKELIPDYNAQIDSQGKLIRENTKAIDEYIKALNRQALAEAAKGKLSEIYAQDLDLQLEETKNKTIKAQNQAANDAAASRIDYSGDDAGVCDNAASGGSLKEYDNAVSKLKEIAKKRADLKETMNGINKIINENADVLLFNDDKNKKDKATKEQFDAAKAFQKEILAIHDQTAKLLVQQQEDSLQKRLAEIDLEKDLEIQKITEKEVAIIDAYNKSHKDDKGFKSLSTKPEDINASINAIDPELAKKLNDEMITLDNAFLGKRTGAYKKWGDDITKLAGESADKRVKIEFGYQAKITDLENKAAELEKLAADPTASPEVKAWATQKAAEARTASEVIQQESDNAVSVQTASYIKDTESYKLATDEKLQISKELTQKLIDDIKLRIKAEQEEGSLSDEDAQKLLDKVNSVQVKKSVNKSNDPFTNVFNALSDQSNAHTALDNAKSDPKTTLTQLADLEDAANKADEAVGKTASTAVAGVGRVLNDVMNGMDQLGILDDETKKSATEIIGVVDGVSKMLSGNPLDMISGGIEIITNLFALFDTKTKKAEKQIANDQKAIDALAKAYNKLEEAIGSAFSTDKAQLLNQEYVNLQQQQKLIANQRRAEQSKSHPDTKALDAYDQKLDDISQKEIANRDALIEALTGETVMSAIDEFAQAYADAFTTGEDAAAKSADVVKNLFKTALLETLKKDLQPGTTKLMNDLAAFMSDGIITAQEQAIIDSDKKALDTRAQQDQKMYSDLGLVDNSTAKGIQGDVQNMTEDTGSALVGQIVAMRLNVAEIVGMYQNSAEMMSQQIAIQQRIADNTEFCRKLERMDSTMEYWRVNGLKVI